jgi:hypothetical protein
VAVRSGGRRIESFNIDWDKEAPTEHVAACARLLAPGGAFVSFCDLKDVGALWRLCAASGLRPASPVYWYRHDPPPNPRLSFCSAIDAAVYAVRPGAPRHWAGGGTTNNVYQCSPSKGRDRWDYPHPTQKPVELMRWLIRLVTPEGGTVLDPFAGSGTTGVAAMQEGARAVLIEREPEYVEIIKARMEAATRQGVLNLEAS